ncbi:MAG: hypothetical protein ACE5HA_05560 [Anaerolineae bacterium]
MTTLHQIIGYLLLFGAGAGLLWSGFQNARRNAYGDTDQNLSDAFLAGLYVELLLGLLLFMLNPRSVIAVPAHPILSVMALAVVQLGRKPRGRSDRDQQLFKAGIYLFAGVLILVGIVVN